MCRTFITACCALSLALGLAGCIPGGGGGGGGDDPIGVDDSGAGGAGGAGEDGSVVMPDPDPDPDPETDPDPDPEAPPPVGGPADCVDADAEWSAAWREFEDEVVVLVNERRAEGADCDSMGVFEPTGPLTSDEQLRCAARLHSRDMGERGYFDHLDPQGVDPFVRIQAAEYTGFPGGENIAAGALNPEQVVQGWMDSDGHCSNIMEPRFNEIGVGYAEVPGSDWRVYWTQVFGVRR